MSTNQFDSYKVVCFNVDGTSLIDVTNDDIGKATIQYANVKYKCVFEINVKLCKKIDQNKL